MSEAREIIVITNYFSNSSSEYGGAQMILSELSEKWADMGCDVTVVKIRPDLEDGSTSGSDKIKWVSFWPRSKNALIRNLLLFRPLYKFLNERKHAVILTFGSGLTVVSLLSYFIKNKIVISERNDPHNNPTGKLNRKLRNWKFKHADAYVFQTEDARKYYSKAIQSKGVIIPNPINPNLPARYNGVRKKVIIAACRLVPQKNIPMLIKAFEKLSRDFPEYSLEIYGKGPLEGDLKKEIASFGMKNRIKLMGFSTNVIEIMSQCAMYVSSSDYEGISNSMLEAMALGLPCVCTDCPVGGARLAIQDGENGLLVPVGDAEAMYRAMKRVIDEPTFAEKISWNAYQIREKYSLDNISRQWLDVM